MISKLELNSLDLANDQNVDLVVCTVRVDRHYKTIIPAIKAGKNVLVEWPLGKNLQEAEELLKLTKEYNVKLAAVGCQGRFDSTFRTVKSLIDKGKIGKILSTSVVGPGIIGGLALDLGSEYLSQIEIGGNLVTIPFGHFMDSFTHGMYGNLFHPVPIIMPIVLGEPKSFESVLAVQRPTVKIINKDGSTAKKDIKVTSHDQILVHGKLNSGAVFSINVRGGDQFKGESGVDWRIYGEKGEVWVKALNMHMQIFGGTSICHHNFEKDEVEEIDFLEEEFNDMYPIHRNVARLYEAVAAADPAAFCTFEHAVKRHRFIDALYKQNGVN